ncbi:MAG: glycosyl hydrolase [Porcipelethomonas sp.]
MRKYRAVVLLLSAALIFTACEDISQEPLDKREYPVETTSAAEEETAAYTEYAAEVPEIVTAEASMTIQAEECKLNGSLYVADKRSGYSGDGYVSGFYGGSADYLVIPADIPASQHYDITICVAADTHVTNSISVNGDDIGDFEIDGEDGKFVRVTFYGTFIEEGEALIQINKGDNEFDVDYIEINNNQDIYESSLEIEAEPVSEKSSYEARDLLRYFKENLGENIITGQYASDSKNLEMELIYKTTGKYPAIRFGDIGGYAQGEPPMDSEIKAALDWDERGGIVGFMWYWNSPSDDSSVYAKDTAFSLESAVTEEDIAELGISDIQELCREGKISRECLALVEDIDKVSAGLSELAENGVPVLWRPLHEAGGGWYWWGADGAEPYIWLYNLMYDRMTKYHGLDNLIWIWNGQSEEYLVDEDRYDIAAIDIYLAPNTAFGSRSEQYHWLMKITESKKMIALSECSSIPGINEMLRDNSVWSYFGLWYGDYLSGNEGNPDEVYTTTEDLIRMYNAENSITLDEYAGVYGHQ